MYFYIFVCSLFFVYGPNEHSESIINDKTAYKKVYWLDYI